MPYKSPSQLFAEILSNHDQIQKYQTAVSQDSNVQMRPIGLQFTATQGTTTHYTWQFPESLCLKGGIIHVFNNVVFDKVDLKITDEDNVLGYGAGFVVSDYVKDWNVPASGIDNILDESISDPIASLFYLKVSYNAQPGIDRKVCLNLIAYKSTI